MRSTASTRSTAVELDAASNNGVDNVRALREEAVFSPAAVKKRVYIIDEVHMLSASAFNALLKIIEEPPEHLIFILATTELQKVPATILSRCQRHSFRRIDTAELAAYVEHVANAEHFAITHEAAELIARLAEGGVRDALSLLDQCSAHEKIDVDAVYTTMGLAGKRRIEELFDRIIDHDTESALKSFSKMWMDGKDPIGTLGELFTLMRDVLMLTSEELTAGMGTLQDALIAARSARSPRTTAELCLVTLCSSLLKQDMPDFNARLSRIEEELASGAISFIPRGGSPAPAPREADEEPFEEPEEERPPLPEEDDLPWNEEPPAPAAPCAPWEDEADELDPAQFAEPQPEDALPKRAALPEKKPEPQSVKEPVSTAPPAAAESPAFWSELCRKIGARLPADMRIYPGDETKLRGELRGNVLTLEAEGGFVYNRFNRAEILQRFSDCAAEITGRSVNTILKVLDPAKRETRSLDELKKFPETHVIGQS